MKKALRGAQTLRMAVVSQSQKNFHHATDPLPGGADSQNLISWSHYLYLQTQFDEDRCMQFRVIVVTEPHRPPARHRQGRLQYTEPQFSAQCNKHLTTDNWHKILLKYKQK